jgi:hypothetical protein
MDEDIQLMDFHGPFFHLKFPSHWEVEILEDIPAFFDPMGGGALQIAAFKKSDEPVNLEDEMTRYLGQLKMPYDPDKIASFELAAGPCLACEFIREDRFWLVNMLGKDGQLLIIIYNADEVPDPDTVGILMDIIKSIRLEES